MAEKIRHGFGSIWAVAIDLKKMFILLSAEVAGDIVHCMGLAWRNVQEIVNVVSNCVGFWRLPLNLLSHTFHRSKGLPKGKAWHHQS